MSDQAELDIAILREQVEVLTTQNTIARGALLRISSVDPARFIKQPASGKNLSIVKAFEFSQELAERGLTDMADIELSEGE